MENLLKDILGVFCYLDDILITGATETEHNEHLRKVLAMLQSAGLRLSIEKCSIGVPHVLCLGFLIDKEGIHPTQAKVQAIPEAPAPTNVTQLRAYLGLINFYRRFLPQAATKLEPLNRLLKAHTPWSWGKEQESAFSESKKTLVKSSALVHFGPKLPLVVVEDSSAYCTGAVLCHLIDGVEGPICFASHTLMSAEHNYSRLVVLSRLRPSLLGELHAAHLGSSRMKELARSYLWWPNLDCDLEGLTNSCPECLSQRALPAKAELHPWEWPTHPWHRIHVDYAGLVDGRYFIVVVDARSKWVDIYSTSGTTIKETIKCLQHSFAQFGLPVSIVSDNGPCFAS